MKAPITGATARMPRQASPPARLRAVIVAALAGGVLAVAAPVASAAAIALDGTAQTATIATIGQTATYTFTATAGQRVSVVADTATFTSGTLELRRLTDNARVQSLAISSKGAFIEPVLLDAGTYELRVKAGTAVGTARLRAWSVTDASVNVAVGAATAVSIATPGQRTNLRFTGTAGQAITARAASATMIARYELRAPDGTLLATSTDERKGLLAGTAPFLDQTRLPAAGTYTLVVDPHERAVGAVTATVVQVADVTATLALGTASALTTTVAGQSVRAQVALTAGRRVSLRAQTSLNGALSLLAPDGSVLAKRTTASGGAFVEPISVPSTGTYTVLFDPVGATTGIATLTAFDVPADASSTITLGADASAVTLAGPGQNARLTFTGTAGRRVSVHLTSATFAGTVALLRPDGTTLASRTIASGKAFVEPVTLPAAGTYTIAIDPAAAATGTASIRAFDVPADIAATLTPGGAAVTASLTGAGQTARITFSGTAGQRISVAATDGTFASSTSPIKLLRPTGTSLAQMTVGAAGFIEPLTLPSTGTYTLLVDPIDAALGTISLRAYVVADSTGSTTIGADAATFVLATPGQVARITFAATAGTRVTLTLGQVTMTGGNVSILRPDATRLAGPLTFGAAGRTVVFVPTTTGNHTLVIDPAGAATGAASVTLRAG